MRLPSPVDPARQDLGIFSDIVMAPQPLGLSGPMHGTGSSVSLSAIMIFQEVDLVAGDFNGTACRYRSKDNLSTIDETFTDSALPTPPLHHAESTLYLGLTEIPKQNFGYTNTQSLVLF